MASADITYNVSLFIAMHLQSNMIKVCDLSDGNEIHPSRTHACRNEDRRRRTCRCRPAETHCEHLVLLNLTTLGGKMAATGGVLVSP